VSNIEQSAHVLLQGLGKAIKDLMKAKYEADFDARHDDWVDGKIKAGERRVLMGKWLDEAWIEFFKNGGQAQVTKAFKRCGMYNAIDGSEDSEIRVQGIANYEIGDSSDEERPLVTAAVTRRVNLRAAKIAQTVRAMTLAQTARAGRIARNRVRKKPMQRRKKP